MAEQEPVIGIDLGTTNSVVAIVQGGQPHVIKNRTGQALTPSVVAVTSAGKRLVGQLAKRQAITNPENTVYASKRLIGRKFSSDQVRRARESLPYQIVSGEHDDVRVQMADKAVSLPEISAAVLRELKLDAEAALGRTRPTRPHAGCSSQTGPWPRPGGSPSAPCWPVRTNWSTS